MRAAPRNLALAGLAALTFAAGLATAVFTIVAIYRLHVVLPVWDEWVSVDDLRRLWAGTYGLADLARQYNEHRLLVPRLFFLVDDIVFGMSDRFNLAVMFAFQALNAAILIGLMARLVAARAVRWLLSGFILLVLFSLRQEQNFTFGFQLQFTGVFTFAMLATLAFVAALDRFGSFGAEPRPGAWLRLVLALLLGAASTYTMANGVLALPTLLVLGLLVRAPWRALLATAVVAAGLAAVYFHGYEPGTLGLPLAAALADPWAYPVFLAGLMGNLVGNDFTTTQILGALGLAGAALAAARIATGRSREPASAALVAVMGFMVASACATTYGRIGVGIMQAYEGRYVEPTVLFWCALVVFWSRALPSIGPAALRHGGAAALAGTMLVLAVALGGAEIRAWPDMVAQAAKFAAFRDGLLGGIFDRDVARYEIFSEDDLTATLAFLRENHLSLFGTPEAAEFGRPIGDLGAMAAGGCAGSVTAQAEPATLGRGGVRLSGTAWDEAANRPVRRVLMAGPDGRVTGFGSLEKPAERSRRWTGVAKSAAGEPVSAYAVLDDGSLCALGTAAVR